MRGLSYPNAQQVRTMKARPRRPIIGGHCLHCGSQIVASSYKEWHQVCKAPCPHCGKRGW